MTKSGAVDTCCGMPCSAQVGVGGQCLDESGILLCAQVGVGVPCLFESETDVWGFEACRQAPRTVCESAFTV